MLLQLVSREITNIFLFMSDDKISLLPNRPRLTCDRGLRGLGGGEELEEEEEERETSRLARA